MKKCNKIIEFIKNIYKKDFIALHEPIFIGNEKKYICDTVDSTFVSSVGEYVNKVEEKICEITGAKYAVAVVNGTNGLHLALKVVGVNEGDEVITQALTFVATSNAIVYAGAKPVFVDVDLDTLGMSSKSLRKWLEKNAIKKGNETFNKTTGNRIKAVVPMHTFGHPCRIDEIKKICDEWNLELIEDSAESLGSLYKNKHTGTFGKVGVFSFNGNKIVTSGGGGMIVTNDESLAKRLKHLSTTAKVPHKWEYFHDEVGYNYRMPNLNAALLLAQLENLDKFLRIKRDLAKRYKKFFENIGIEFINEPKNAKSNFWLNAIKLKDINERDEFLECTNNNGVMTRPIWTLMNKLPMYKNCQNDGLENSRYLEERIVNIPSGVVV